MTTQNTNDLTRLYARPGFLLRRAHQISASVFESECQGVGLTPAQFGILTVLHVNPGMDQSSLARALGFDKVTVLRVLRGLETRGLISRAAAPASRRSLSLKLTPEGTALLAQAQKPAERAFTKLLSPLNSEQQGQLLSLLELLTNSLEENARARLVRADRP